MRVKDSPYPKEGFVLIVVLGMIMALTVILLGFNRSARIHLKTAEVLRKSQQAINCTHAGLNVAIAAIRQDDPLPTHNSMRPFLCGDQVLPLKQGSCRIELTTESGKLNLNKLKDSNGRLDQAQIDQLLRLIDLLNKKMVNGERISYGIVPAIIDWTDNDDEVTHLHFVKKENIGAESEYYKTLDPSLTPSNQALDSCSEILQIRGITPLMYQQLKEHITVKGEGRIDINSASTLILQSFSPEIDPARARIILNRRKIMPYTNLQELSELPGISSKIYAAIGKTATVAPSNPYYRVRLIGDAGGIQHRAEALLKKNTRTRNVDVIHYVEI